MARFSAALYLAADNEPHEIPIFSPANYSLNVDLHLRTNLQQYIGPLVKLLYDYNGIDFHLFTNLIRCDGWRKLFISEMSPVLQTTTRRLLVPVDVLVLYSLHHLIRHDVEVTGRHVTVFVPTLYLLL